MGTRDADYCSAARVLRYSGGKSHVEAFCVRKGSHDLSGTASCSGSYVASLEADGLLANHEEGLRYMDIPLCSVSSVPYGWDYGAYAKYPGVCR